MEQFNLNKWLQDKSRKVVTKIGEEVKIIDTNAPDENDPIIGYIYHKQEWNGPWSWHIDGVYKVGGDDMDLFFADEEEELTEFEKDLQTIISDASHWTSDDGSISTYCQFGDKEIKKISTQILDLARKEVMSEISDFEIYDKGFKEGKKYALKDLPKWKKATEHKDLEKHVAILEDGKVLLSNYLEEGDYYIDLEELKTLLK